MRWQVAVEVVQTRSREISGAGLNINSSPVTLREVYACSEARGENNDNR